MQWYCRGFTRRSSVETLNKQPADHDEEDARRKAAHQNAGQTFDRCDKPPWQRQDQIAVAHCRVGDSGKVKRRLDVRQASAPKIEKPPDRNLKQMDEDEEPGHANQQPGNRPEARRRQSSRFG